MIHFEMDRRTALLMAIFPTVVVGLLNGFYLEALHRQCPLLFHLADVTQWIFIPLLTWLFVLRPRGIHFREAGFTNPSSGTSYFRTAGLFVLVTVLLWLAYFPVRKLAYAFLWPYAGTFGYATTIPSSFPLNFIVVFYYAATAAVVEEVVFRGLPWLYFAIAVPATHRRAWYISITSVIFAAVHFEQGAHGMIAALSVGLVASFLYAELRNIWPLIAAHFVCDVISFWPK